MGLVDEKQRGLLLGGDVAEGVTDDGQESGDGVRHGGSAQTETDLAQQLQEASRGGDHGQQAELGRVGLGSGSPEAGALARADLAGDQRDEAVGDRVGEPFEERLQSRQREQLRHRDVGGEGLAGKSVGVREGDHEDSPDSKRLPPW